MPLAPKPRCAGCETRSSTIWRRGIEGEILCNQCYMFEQAPAKELNEGENGASKEGNAPTSATALLNAAIVRKSARQKPSKYRFKQHMRPLSTKGKSRRVIFKKNPIKAPSAVSTVLSRDSIFYKGNYFQVGDIVSVMDEDDGHAYYGQLRGFLQDQYMELSGIITWLLPTTASPPDRFDPATFILGPEEEFPRSMEVFEFVCHAPTEYYKKRDAPFKVQAETPELGFIWTSLGQPEIVPVPSQAELFGMKDPLSEKANKDKTKERKNALKDKKEKIEPVNIKKDKETRIRREKVKMNI